MFQEINVGKQNVRFRNATYEKYDVQCDSKVFVFLPKYKENVVDANGLEVQIPDTMVPMDLAEFVYAQVKDKGVFYILPEDNEESIENKKTEALRSYANGHLKNRVDGYQKYYDELKRADITFEKEYACIQAENALKSLRRLLNEQDLKKEQWDFSSQKKAVGRPKLEKAGE